MCNVNIGGAGSQKRNWGQPKKKSRVSRPITPDVLGLERNLLYLWVASVVLHPNMNLDWLGAAILCPGMTTMQRHPESALRACTMEILYTTLSGSKKIEHQRPHLPGYWVNLNELGTIGKPYSRARQRSIIWYCGTKREAASGLRMRTPRGIMGCV